MKGIHHLEIWIADLDAVADSWDWLFTSLGMEAAGKWPEGRTWDADGAYITLTMSPNLSAAEHDRRRAGMNHLALWGGSRAEVDAVMSSAPAHGWQPLYGDRYPHAGGPDHYAGWLENAEGFKVEVVTE